MKLDWNKIWEDYEKAPFVDDGDWMWSVIDGHAKISEENKLHIDEIWNSMLEDFVGEQPEDNVEYDLPIEDRIELQGAFKGAVELALRLQDRIENNE